MRRRVLILGSIPRIVIPIARSLAKHGIPVDATHFTSAKRIRSRFIEKFVRVPSPKSSAPEFAAQLQRFIRERGHDMLIPADDQALTAMMEHYEEFNNILHVACPPPSVTRQVLNKATTLEVAQKCGIRIPNTKVVTNSMQLFELANTFPFPWVLKPAEKETSVEETKSYNFANAGEVAMKFPESREFAPPMLLQERCEGVGVGVEMLMHDGECVAVFQHRRLKELPHTGGYAVTAIAEKLDAALFQSSVALLRALHWEGVAMVEFKVNRQHGSAVLMEVNGRCWGSISLAIYAGVNFPLYQWQLTHGESVRVPKAYREGAKWRWTAGYLARLHGLLLAARRSASARETLYQDLAEFPKDFMSSTRDPLFSLSDPIAGVFDVLIMIGLLFTGDLQALVRACRPR